MDWTESNYSRDTAIRFARAGALVCIAAAEDACAVCQARADRIYAPSDVPRLPIRGCLRESCRCRFVAVDPETELSVPQLVQRGIHALRAGRKELARQTLRRAVALDEMHEHGWLWLSAVVDNREKIACLEKVLAINPHNRRAQAGLESLRKQRKVSAPSAPEPELERVPSASVAEVVAPGPPEPEEGRPLKPVSEVPTVSPTPVPSEVIEVREEREIIIEQWADFTSIAIETDPQMLLMQGRAFLRKLDTLNQQVLEMLPPETHLGELQLQWQESNKMTEALYAVFKVHNSRPRDTSTWQTMNEAVRELAQQLLSHRRTLQAQISAAGGHAPET